MIPGVIPVAGRGSRAFPKTSGLPKVLLEVGGKTMESNHRSLPLSGDDNLRGVMILAVVETDYSFRARDLRRLLGALPAADMVVGTRTMAAALRRLEWR